MADIPTTAQVCWKNVEISKRACMNVALNRTQQISHRCAACEKTLTSGSLLRVGVNVALEPLLTGSLARGVPLSE